MFGPDAIGRLGDAERWRWVAGALAGFSQNASGMLSEEAFTNVQAKVEILFRPQANASVVVRGNPNNQGPFPFRGYIVKATNMPERQAGSLIGCEELLEKSVKEYEWFTLHVIAVGNRIMVRLNGRTVVDYVDASAKYASGHIALVHGNESGVLFRNFRAQALPTNEAEAWKEVRKAAPEVK